MALVALVLHNTAGVFVKLLNGGFEKKRSPWSRYRPFFISLKRRMLAWLYRVTSDSNNDYSVSVDYSYRVTSTHTHTST